METFRHLGLTLALLRGLRRRSQVDVAREAGIGKSQLSKYEGGKELPKLDSLAKILDVLEVTPLGFFYTLHLIERRVTDTPVAGVPVSDASVLFARSGEALNRLLEDAMRLHGVLAEERLLLQMPKLAEVGRDDDG